MAIVVDEYGGTGRAGHDRGPARRDRRRDPRRIRRARGSADRAGSSDHEAIVDARVVDSRRQRGARTCTCPTTSSTRSAAWSTTSLARCQPRDDQVRVNGCLLPGHLHRGPPHQEGPPGRRSSTTRSSARTLHPCVPARCILIDSRRSVSPSARRQPAPRAPLPRSPDHPRASTPG